MTVQTFVQLPSPAHRIGSVITVAVVVVVAQARVLLAAGPHAGGVAVDVTVPLVRSFLDAVPR